MNAENYASLEASRRLVEAGIVLETETVWARYGTSKKWNIELLSDYLLRDDYECILAPSMAEVWRELPGTDELMDLVRQYAMATLGEFWQATNPVRFVFEMFRDINRLIDLLIWVTAQKEGGRDDGKGR